MTVLRLALELGHAPAWLANSDVGGPGSLIGVAWLPFVFGPWFALRIQRAAPGGPLWRPLIKTLLLYGFAARLPVVLLTIPALFGGWDTHYEKFPFEASDVAKLGATVAAQLGFWGVVWTLATGLLAARVVLWLRPRPSASFA
ncbi:MAG: hypothetical protein KDE27_10840 [Planctomycetes bacterium]|nr:hypothetical protein [Planctomycetota bacterium]